MSQDKNQPLLLCVDDEEPGLMMRAALFASAGYGVFTATSGEAGIQAFVENDVSAVVLDYLMPGMNGEQVAAAMRQLKPTVPILLLSGCLSLPDDVFKLVDAFLPKGGSPEMLIETVRQLVEGAPAVAAIATASGGMA